MSLCGNGFSEDKKEMIVQKPLTSKVLWRIKNGSLL